MVKYSLVFMFLLTFIVSCSQPTGQATGIISQKNVDAIGTMEVEFVGDYTRAEIKTRMNSAMGLYSLPINEQNYNIAASALIAERKYNDVGEMDILAHMIRTYEPDVKVSFQNQAANSAFALIEGR